MAIDILDIVVIIIPIIIAVSGGVYVAAKKLFVDFVKAIEDDNIDKAELELLIQDGISFINVIKNIINLILRR